jgi:dipeptidase E
MRILLIGATGSPYFEHCKQNVLEFLGSSKKLGLVTAANPFDEKAYFRAMDEQLTGNGVPITRELVHVRWNFDWRDALKKVDALVIPGGNTYVLLKRLHQSGMLDALRHRIREGLPYIGSSAGANVAGPNILTTNDWNVAGLTHFEALGLVPFNINPHYVERSASDATNSETRAQRIREYHQFWKNPVLGIEETAVVRVLGAKPPIVGKGRAKLFAGDGGQRWFEAGEQLVWDNWTPFYESRFEGEEEIVSR